MSFEYMPCQDLQEIIKLHPEKKLSLALTKLYTVEIVKALSYLRINKSMHRDLKPMNIMLDERFHIKVCDFGCAIKDDNFYKTFIGFISDDEYANFTEVDPEIQYDDTSDDSIALSITTATNKESSRPIGSIQWMSPEMLKFRVACYASDTWALGCIVYQ